MVTQKMLRTHEGFFFGEKNIRFVTAFDLIKRLNQIENYRLLLLARSSLSELPSNLGSMVGSFPMGSCTNPVLTCND